MPGETERLSAKREERGLHLAGRRMKWIYLRLLLPRVRLIVVGCTHIRRGIWLIVSRVCNNQ